MKCYLKLLVLISLFAITTNVPLVSMEQKPQLACLPRVYMLPTKTTVDKLRVSLVYDLPLNELPINDTAKTVIIHRPDTLTNDELCFILKKAPQVEELWIYESRFLDNNTLTFVGQFCKSLVKLGINNCPNIDFTNIPPWLKTVCLSQLPQLNDAMLSEIMTKLPNIEELLLSCCSEIRRPVFGSRLPWISINSCPTFDFTCLTQPQCPIKEISINSEVAEKILLMLVNAKKKVTYLDAPWPRPGIFITINPNGTMNTRVL